MWQTGRGAFFCFINESSKPPTMLKSALDNWKKDGAEISKKVDAPQIPNKLSARRWAYEMSYLTDSN